MQLLTAGADGLLKLWSIKTSECIGTFDNHDGRVWALAGLCLFCNPFESAGAIQYEQG